MPFDLVKFNQQTYTVMTETLDQDVQKFNTASGGAINLVAKPFKGDFDIEASFKAIANLVRRRNVDSNTAIASARLEQHKKVAVKVATGTPEILWTPAQYAWTLQNPELAAIKTGEQLARASLADMLNTAVKCTVAALKGNTDLVYDATATTLDFKALTVGASKFGDRSGAIKAWVMHSGAQTNLYLNALGNIERLFSYESVNVIRDPFGRIIVVTDAPDLTYMTTGIAPKVAFNTLGLVDGGAVINNQNDFNSVIVPKTGKENIEQAYQAEWSYSSSVLGYTWDTTNGGASPTDTALGTSTNWDKIATSNKDTAGVLVQSL